MPSNNYACVFSGISAASAAWMPLGFKPELFAETGKYPSLFLRHKYPEVPNLGDVNLVDWSKYRDRFRVLIGGSPCQSFSRQGKRENLSDDRGQLTLKFAEIVDETNPELFIWENVQQILNTNDNTFGKFLTQLLGQPEELRPPLPERGWESAGLLVGGSYALGWRIIDPREFNIPQRRARIFLVGLNSRKLRGLFEATSGCDENWLAQILAQILFVAPGGGGNSSPSRKEKPRAARESRQEAEADCWGFSHLGYGQDMSFGISPTLRSVGNSGNSNASVFYNDCIRRLTPVEYLRLQGFADDYLDIPRLATDTVKYQAIGNSICVPILRHILSKYLETIAGIKGF